MSTKRKKKPKHNKQSFENFNKQNLIKENKNKQASTLKIKHSDNQIENEQEKSKHNPQNNEETHLKDSDKAIEHEEIDLASITAADNRKFLLVLLFSSIVFVAAWPVVSIVALPLLVWVAVKEKLEYQHLLVAFVYHMGVSIVLSYTINKIGLKNIPVNLAYLSLIVLVTYVPYVWRPIKDLSSQLVRKGKFSRAALTIACGIVFMAETFLLVVLMFKSSK